MERSSKSICGKFRVARRSVKSISGPDGTCGAPGSAARGKSDKEVRVLATDRVTRVQARSKHGLISGEERRCGVWGLSSLPGLHDCIDK